MIKKRPNVVSAMELAEIRDVGETVLRDMKTQENDIENYRNRVDSSYIDDGKRSSNIPM